MTHASKRRRHAVIIAAQIPAELVDAADAFMAQKPPEFTRSDLVRLALSELLEPALGTENLITQPNVHWERGPQAPRFQLRR